MTDPVPYTASFHPSQGTRAGTGAVATVFAEHGVLPTRLTDPLDLNGAPVVGNWEYDEADHERRLVSYRPA